MPGRSVPLLLTLVVVALLGVAIAVQLSYVRGIQRAGVEVTRATKVVSYANIAMLALLALGLLVYAVLSQLGMVGR